MKNKTIAFIDEFLENPLRDLGFKKRQAQWNRRRGDFVDVISVQEATYSSEESVSITLNLGVFITSFFEAIWGKASTGFVTDADCTVRVRLGDLIQGRLYGDALDQWWILTDRDSIQKSGTEVASAIQKLGIPFFDSKHDYDAIATHLRGMVGGMSRNPTHFLNRGLSEWRCGNKAEAVRQLDEVSAKAWLPKVDTLRKLFNSGPEPKKPVEV